jgi:predicted dienelactone hydrolase
MTPARRIAAAALVQALIAAPLAVAADLPSRPGIDAPELARLGEHAVGVRTLSFTQPGQVSLWPLPDAGNPPARGDRVLVVDLWYPAKPVAGATAEPYRGNLVSEPPAPPAGFTIPALAVRDAPAVPGPHPLVVLSHGYGNVTAVFSWLTENLASKGYVVAAIRHDDPPITRREGFPQLLLRRPLDIVFVTAQLQASLAAEDLIDPARTALIGYSVGGYGVLTAAGAQLSPDGGAVKMVPGDQLAPYARGGAAAGTLAVPGLRAVVALAPAGHAPLAAWGEEGLRGIAAPLFMIAGDHDLTVDYATSARAIFDRASATTRYLLTYKGAGHAIGFGPAPPAMRRALWDQDWFEDPVWRKERLTGINLHFITAFLDLYVKGDGSRAAYLDGLVPESDAGRWETPPPRWDAYSPGDGGITVWKGFQRRHATGMQLLRAASGP